MKRNIRQELRVERGEDDTLSVTLLTSHEMKCSRSSSDLMYFVRGMKLNRVEVDSWETLTPGTKRAILAALETTSTELDVVPESLVTIKGYE